eukprot:COSAG03_NODE_5641_length_1204_cov_1.408145_2_plen_160_part_00
MAAGCSRSRATSSTMPSTASTSHCTSQAERARGWRAHERERKRECVCVRACACACACVWQRAALHNSFPSVLPLIFEPLVKDADFYCTQYVPVFLPLYLVVYNSITARIHWISYKSKQRQILRGADTYHILPFPDGVNWDGTISFEHYVTMNYRYTLHI